MPEKQTIERGREDKRQGKSPRTQAGEFVREEMEHIREGKHGARSTKQAIAIGLSKARRAGVDLPPPARGKTTERDTQERPASLGAGPWRAAQAPALGQALPRHSSGAGARRKVCGLACGAVETSARGGSATDRRRTLRGCSKGSADERACQAPRGGYEGSPHQRTRGIRPSRPQSGTDQNRACVVSNEE